MSEENETISDDIFEDDVEDEEPYTPEEEEKGHGPGFRLGILVGLLVGAVVAVLMAPPTGEEQQGEGGSQHESSSSSPDLDLDSPFARISSMSKSVMRASAAGSSRGCSWAGSFSRSKSMVGISSTFCSPQEP